MERNSKLLNKIMLAMLVAMGVVISPILRVEGMCPMSSVINIVCAVILGPWYALLCAVMIGIIRMSLMGIPPLALTGAVFGAALSGILYRKSNGKIIFAVLGEVIGTGIVGALASYPVMRFIWGRSGLTWLFYMPLFFTATIIGGTIAFLFLRALSKIGILSKTQKILGAKVCDRARNDDKELTANQA
ncbi:energy coupling factor transporter S component ThiW [Clostridium sp. 19966]|uniref:energy coupling factor transporter S component ThiW n=1 Tax=Clostridium sp. 19966 TaxID=2768166 RepID=UPI0028DF706A|nr:energy coupling factor transporter S component ThiW [Clostridium sp. 19966]MDT8718779.1 energy coupling factor transporter S component ThiW [Clostridium sp. 19966]